MSGLFWKTKKVVAATKKKKINFMVRNVPFWYEGIGLMFKSKKNTKPLLFNFKFSSKMSIFSSFIPYNFLAVWIDKNNKIIEYRIVKPGENGISPHKKFKKLIEIPYLNRYKKIYSFFISNKNLNISFSF